MKIKVADRAGHQSRFTAFSEAHSTIFLNLFEKSNYNNLTNPPDYNCWHTHWSLAPERHLRTFRLFSPVKWRLCSINSFKRVNSLYLVIEGIHKCGSISLSLVARLSGQIVQPPTSRSFLFKQIRQINGPQNHYIFTSSVNKVASSFPVTSGYWLNWSIASKYNADKSTNCVRIPIFRLWGKLFEDNIVA